MGLVMKKWRLTTWLVIVVNVAFAIWLVAALGYTDPCDMRGEITARCARRTPSSGGGVGAMTILGLWTLADIVLAVVWLATKRNKDDAPNVYRARSQVHGRRSERRETRG